MAPNALLKQLSVAKSATLLGLLYLSSSWVRISWIHMVEFHPVNVGVFNTLNWLGTSLSSMQKHARWMFFNDLKYFESRTNASLIIFIMAGVPNGVYGRCPERCVHGCGARIGWHCKRCHLEEGVHMGANARPAHPWMKLRGYSSWLSAFTTNCLNAWSLEKSGHGAT